MTEVTSDRRRLPILPIVLILVLVAVVGALASIPFLARERAPELSATEAITFSGELGSIRVAGEIALVEAGVVRILVDPGSGGSGAIPMLSLNMPEHEMQALTPPVQPLPNGRFEARATLPMSGYWQLVIGMPDGWTAFGFRLPE